VSGRMGCVKPHSLIYEMLEAGENAQGARILFADDRLENIEMAASRGWVTHLFEGPQGWAETLVSVGLLTNSEAGL
jgi:2-haloacid dehalogenase